MKKYNNKGIDITDKVPGLADLSYGYYNQDGSLVIRWKDYSSRNADPDGFDKTYLGGDYKRKILLPKGAKICRYGGYRGVYTTLVGTPYHCLGLPYIEDSMEYHEFEVIADGLVVSLIVEEEIVAPAFDSPGGGIQYLHRQNIAREISSG